MMNKILTLLVQFYMFREHQSHEFHVSSNSSKTYVSTEDLCKRQFLLGNVHFWKYECSQNTLYVPKTLEFQFYNVFYITLCVRRTHFVPERNFLCSKNTTISKNLANAGIFVFLEHNYPKMLNTVFSEHGLNGEQNTNHAKNSFSSGSSSICVFAEHTFA